MKTMNDEQYDEIPLNKLIQAISVQLGRQHKGALDISKTGKHNKIHHFPTITKTKMEGRYFLYRHLKDRNIHWIHKIYETATHQGFMYKIEWYDPNEK